MKEQIEKLARDICHLNVSCDECTMLAKQTGQSKERYCKAMQYAKRAYEKGWRKQSEGEWETIPDYRPEKLIAYRHICSVCKNTYKDIRPHGHKYCHECGAKMKGGAE